MNEESDLDLDSGDEALLGWCLAKENPYLPPTSPNLHNISSNSTSNYVIRRQPGHVEPPKRRSFTSHYVMSIEDYESESDFGDESDYYTSECDDNDECLSDVSDIEVSQTSCPKVIAKRLPSQPKQKQLKVPPKRPNLLVPGRSGVSLVKTACHLTERPESPSKRLKDTDGDPRPTVIVYGKPPQQQQQAQPQPQPQPLPKILYKNKRLAPFSAPVRRRSKSRPHLQRTFVGLSGPTRLHQLPMTPQPRALTPQERRRPPKTRSLSENLTSSTFLQNSRNSWTFQRCSPNIPGNFLPTPTQSSHQSSHQKCHLRNLSHPSQAIVRRPMATRPGGRLRSVSCAPTQTPRFSQKIAPTKQIHKPKSSQKTEISQKDVSKTRVMVDGIYLNFSTTLMEDKDNPLDVFLLKKEIQDGSFRRRKVNSPRLCVDCSVSFLPEGIASYLKEAKCSKCNPLSLGRCRKDAHDSKCEMTCRFCCRMASWFCEGPLPDEVKSFIFCGFCKDSRQEDLPTICTRL